ncbi:hypothetical protein DM02DRAFT_524235 [Periconia macrospinosa]|uniref:Cytochrome P450 n=1 Tax=Periconia macrospinosa TaxID=97972 RepID=A0A2V1DUG3_9PLEO|nr:hypothetical protein DM02DRAFT_524235 [Periconia macrospinosa]
MVKSYRDTIRFQPNGTKYKGRHLEARVLPNWDLVEKFGIYNAFTSKMKSTSDANIKEAIEKMEAAIHLGESDRSQDWRDLMAQARSGLYEYMKQKGEQVDLVELVRYITLKTSLNYLFKDAKAAEKNPEHFKDMLYVSSHLNELLVTYERAADRLPGWSEQEDLHAALRRVTLSIPTYVSALNSTSTRAKRANSKLPEPMQKYRNPLNLLMHAYDTIWRVVLRCFLEIRFRNAENGPEWSEMMKHYTNMLWESAMIDVTSDNRFVGPLRKSSTLSLKPHFIINEALRLYPPISRIQRQYDGELHEVDLEACHRSSLLGDDDPLVFRPERWRDLSRPRKNDYAASSAKREQERLGFMPFALSCPSNTEKTKEFGTKMIGMLVGILCTELGEEWELKDGRDDLPELGKPLDNDRGAYPTLLLANQKPCE